MRIALILVLLAMPALSQTPSPDAPPSSPTPAQTSATAPAPQTSKPAEVSADAAVITLRGFCPSMPAGTDQKSPECKTVITRAEFENLANTLSPNMPPAVRQRLAQEYSQMLVLSDQAKKNGLDKTPRFEQIAKFMTMRMLAQGYVTNVQETSKPTAADVDKYYQDNKSKYEELTVNRVFIPRNRPAPASSKTPEPKPLTNVELQAQGEKYRARLAAGESFDKVQKEAYEASGFSTPPPPTITSKRREGSAPEEQELFTLKKGDLSKVIVDAAGASIYQVQDTKVTPLEEVKPGIEAQLTSEHMRQRLEGLSSIAKPELNQAYFQSLQPQEPVRAMTPGAPGAGVSPSNKITTPQSVTPKPSSQKPGATTPKAVPKK